MKKPIIVFDLDDTLYPERDFVMSGFRAAADWLSSQVGPCSFYRDAVALFEKGVRGNIFDLALEAASIASSTALIAKLLHIYRSHQPNIKLFTDAEEVLNKLYGQHPLALITDGYYETQLNKIASLGIKPVFQKLVLTDEFGRAFWKPHKKGYIEITTFFQCSSRDCIYIADNPHKDFVTAKKLGWQTVRVRRNGCEHSLLNLADENEAHFQVTNLHAFLEKLSGFT